MAPRRSKGKVHLVKDETATRHAGSSRSAAGAAIGAIFPAVAVLGAAAVGGVVGGVTRAPLQGNVEVEG